MLMRPLEVERMFRNGRLTLVAVLLAVLVVAGCGRKREETLLDAMPEGYSLYITFTPSGIGLEEILDKIGDALENSGEMTEEASAVLGFSPLDFEEWEDALALRTDEEIGILVAVQNDDEEPEMMAFFVPSDDLDKVEAVFSLAEEQGGMKTEFFQWNENYTVAVIAEETDIIDDFEKDIDAPLSADETFSAMREHMSTDKPMLEMYLDGSDFTEMEELEAVMLASYVEESYSSFNCLIQSNNVEIAQAMSLLGEKPGEDLLVPRGAQAAFQISFNMDAVADMAAENMNSDARTGIGILGFSSIEEMMSIFSNEALMAFGAEDGEYAGTIVYGLDDSDAAADLMDKLVGFAGMAGEEGIETFEFDGNQAIVIDAEIVEGIDRIEVGIAGNAMVVTGGFSLQDYSDGERFSSMFKTRSGNLEDKGSFALVADVGAISRTFDLEGETDGMINLDDFGWFSLTGGVTEEGYLNFAGSLDVGSGNPFVTMAELAILTGMRSYHSFNSEVIEMPPPEEPVEPDRSPTRMEPDRQVPSEGEGGDKSGGVPQIKIVAPTER